MCDSENPEVRIPHEWKNAVCGVLRRNEPKTVIVHPLVNRNWHENFSGKTDLQRNEAIVESLLPANVMGKRLTNQNTTGEIYSFWVIYDDTKLYAKIELLRGERSIIICSLHPPSFGNDQL